MSSGRVAVARRRVVERLTRREAWIRVGILAIAIATVVTVAWRLDAFERETLLRLEERVHAFSRYPWFLPAFVSLYALLITLGLPASPLLIAGGAVFGIFPGALYNWMGATLGAIGGYWMGRALGGGTLRVLLGRKSWWLDRLRDERGFMNILRLRVSLVVPFTLMNIASGMARLPFRQYAMATALGVIPGTVAYTSFAERLLSGARGADRAALQQAAVIGAAAILLSLAPRIVRTVRQRREAAAASRGDPR